MSDYTAIRLPQMGANDRTAEVVTWEKETGDHVNRGELLCTAENTKSTFDVESPGAGHLVIIAEPGSEVEVGGVLAVLAPEPITTEQAQEWLAGMEAQQAEAAAPKQAWTKKAELLAQQHGVDITTVPVSGVRVTEADVLAYVGTTDRTQGAHATPADVADLVDDRYPTGRIERLLIIGGGDGAVQIIDAVAKTAHQRVVCIVDDNTALHGKSVAGVPVIGNVDVQKIAAMQKAGEIDSAIVSVSTSIPFRARIFTELRQAGVPFANVIHPSAVIGMNVSMGQGNVILAFCHIGACAIVGDNNFVSAYCSIEHHNQLDNHCSFGPGVVSSSKVHIADRVRFGTGIYIEPHINIGTESIIGSGCILWKDVPPNSILKTKLNYTERAKKA